MSAPGINVMLSGMKGVMIDDGEQVALVPWQEVESVTKEMRDLKAE